MTAYEAKQEARRERLERAAERAERLADAAHARSDSYVAGIPLGQPILVGHHSEKAHRRALEKSWNAMGRSVELRKAAERYRGMAASVGAAGISSDDPEAVAQLREQLVPLVALQERMKKTNAIIRRMKANPAACILTLQAEGFAAGTAARLLEPDFCGRFGFPDYSLTNNRANIKRIEGRIAELLARPTEGTEREVGEVRVVEDVGSNRLRLYFKGKPSERARTILKRNGFKWAPSEGAWQRQLNNAARHAERYVFETFKREGVAS